MKDLLEKLEAATEGSRHLDRKILVLMHPGAQLLDGGEDFWLPECKDKAIGGYEIPYYTTSLDDALTLLPAGWVASITVSPNGGRADVVREGADWRHSGSGFISAGPALAVCIAALAARAAQ